MSPEQIRGKPLDGRSDVYALGILAFELFTGQLPFAGKSAQETMIARLRGSPAKLRDLRPELPAKLEAVILRCLAIDPAERFQSMDELAHAFEGVGGDGGAREAVPEVGGGPARQHPSEAWGRKPHWAVNPAPERHRSGPLRPVELRNGPPWRCGLSVPRRM